MKTFLLKFVGFVIVGLVIVGLVIFGLVIVGLVIVGFVNATEAIYMKISRI